MTSETEKEFAEYDSSNSWNEIFQRLKNEASLLTLSDDFSTKEARDPDNRRKNRYRDVSPYDHSRVKISGESDYINASLIEVPEANRKYILTQGPLEHTMADFWQMTWEQDARAIVMLNRVIEKGSWKCSQYWPLGADYGCEDEMVFEECGLKITLSGEQDYQHFTLRTLELEKIETGDKREVLHFHYTTWPDFGVPSSPYAFLHFLHCVRHTGSLESNVGPAIIHCSAGIGRSGTFCLVDSCLILVENRGSLESINVKEMLLQMRSYRMGLIQTPDQLRFSYLAIIQGAQAILNGIGLNSLQNHLEGPPPPPERTTSLFPPKLEIPNVNSLLENIDNNPPPIPPKKSPLQRQPGHSGWDPEDDSSDEDLVDNFKDDENVDEELEKLIDRDEDVERPIENPADANGAIVDSEEERAKAEEMRHRIREERKRLTKKKLDEMKERQRKSERWRPYRPYFRPAVYFGIAVLVGVAGVLVYKYMI
ncbi:tyrosine-protein phosphatase non-receptor type 1-like isoform X1 [Physella acuta]|uniref:tyrosine-protein phosphatase non-receptor type 1-like isoform X1 n=1 Tax=Physella acuta TaxID=109671 RepID=UPI0027DE8E9F|nr:tyrosine-protein phosphatase non-receptor type 1-like isoform X1 [Physella acuta]